MCRRSRISQNGRLATGDEIDRAVVEAQVKLKFRVLARQFRHDRRHAMAAEQHGHRHAQTPGHLPASRLKQRFARAQFFQRPQAALEIDLAILGQRLGAGRAVKQANPRRVSESAPTFNRVEDLKPLRGMILGSVEIVSWSKQRRVAVTNATLRRDLTALSSLLHACVGWGWRDDNPARTWDRSHIKERRDPPKRSSSATAPV